MEMEALDPQQRGDLSRLLRDARLEKGWSVEDLIQYALEALEEQLGRSEHLYPDEISSWKRLDITRHHVATLENCPSRPLSDVCRRGRLLAICLALGLDRDQVNRLSGGI